MFIAGGVYSFHGDRVNLYVCLPCFENIIGKLVQYKKVNKAAWEKTNITYFLNSLPEDDIKSLFLDRENYEIEGRLELNYYLSDKQDFLIKGERHE